MKDDREGAERALVRVCRAADFLTEWTDYDYTAKGPLESKQKKLGVQEAGVDTCRLDYCTRIINKGAFQFGVCTVCSIGD